jgi:hypothetical protein
VCDHERVVIARLIGCALGALTAAGVLTAGAEAGGAPRAPGSGIHGHVILGPTCPVQRPGRTCTRPYAAAITIRREPAGTLAARVRSAADGDFTARLRPGRYLLKPAGGRPYPRAPRQTVTVTAGRFTDVTIRFDSGIR